MSYGNNNIYKAYIKFNYCSECVKTMIILSMFTNMILYVITIVACTVSATLYVSFSCKRSGKLYKIISVLLLSFLAYTILEMFVTFFTELHISRQLFYALTTLSDVAYCSVVVSWLASIITISGNPYLIKIKGFIIYTAIYVIFVDGLNLISKFSPYTFGLGPKDISGILLYTNCIFDITLIIISVLFIFYGALKMKGEKQRKYVLLFSSCLAVYMVYITNWDIISCKDEVPNNILFSSFDPAHIFYVIMCVSVLIMVAKKDSLRADYYMPEILGITVGQEDTWESIAKKYKLTSRELELLTLVCRGMSNPDIAGKLYISESTVKQHLSHIYRKTNVKNRYELIQKIRL